MLINVSSLRRDLKARIYPARITGKIPSIRALRFPLTEAYQAAVST
jgi:hypothetical protein